MKFAFNPSKMVQDFFHPQFIDDLDGNGWEWGMSNLDHSPHSQALESVFCQSEEYKDDFLVQCGFIASFVARDLRTAFEKLQSPGPLALCCKAARVYQECDRMCVCIPSEDAAQNQSGPLMFFFCVFFSVGLTIVASWLMVDIRGVQQTPDC